MQAHEFKYVKSRQRYIRKTEYGFDEFVWYALENFKSGWRGGPAHQGNYGIGIRHNKVQSLLEPLDLIVGKQNKQRASTIHRAVTGQYFPFKKRRDIEFNILFSKREKQSKITTNRMKDMLLTDGLNWFKKYSNLNILYDDMKKLDKKSYLLVNNPETLPLTTAALACIVAPREFMDLKLRSLENTLLHKKERLSSRLDRILAEAEKQNLL